MTDAYQKPVSSVQKAVRMLIEHYEVFFVAPAAAYATTESWLAEYINVPAWQHTIFTTRRDLLYGDYIIAKSNLKAQNSNLKDNSMATLLEYGSDTFKTWEDVIEYFSRLGGQ